MFYIKITFYCCCFFSKQSKLYFFKNFCFTKDAFKNDIFLVKYFSEKISSWPLNLTENV